MIRTPDQVGALYDSLANVEVHERLVWDEDVYRFSAAVTSLRQSVDEDGTSIPMFGRLNRLRFDLAAAPLSPISLEPDELYLQLAEDRAAIEAALPRLRPLVSDVLGALEPLSEMRSNPLLQAVMAEVSKGPNSTVSILLCESRHIAPARAAATKLEHMAALNWITPRELRAANRTDALLVVGAPRWFPEHVFKAARSSVIHAVHYRWISADWSRLQARTFTIARTDEANTKGCKLVIHRDSGRPNQSSQLANISEVELLPSRGLHGLDQITDADNQNWPSADVVDAVVLRLDGGDFLFMEDVEGHRVLIVDLEHDPPVQRTPVSEIESDTYVLIRTEGGGDYVVEVADRLLGPRAKPARATQQRWKARLRQAVDSRGAESLISDLCQRGSKVANQPNLRNWLSPRNIRTRNRVDFDAILAVAGLESESDAIWQQLGLIAKAHQKAGRLIRRRLLAEVRKSNLQELVAHGHLTFELDDGGGSLSAVRVEEVLSDRRRVSRARLDRVFPATWS